MAWESAGRRHWGAEGATERTFPSAILGCRLESNQEPQRVRHTLHDYEWPWDHTQGPHPRVEPRQAQQWMPLFGKGHTQVPSPYLLLLPSRGEGWVGSRCPRRFPSSFPSWALSLEQRSGVTFSLHEKMAESEAVKCLYKLSRLGLIMQWRV